MTRKTGILCWPPKEGARLFLPLPAQLGLQLPALTLPLTGTLYEHGIRHSPLSPWLVEVTPCCHHSGLVEASRGITGTKVSVNLQLATCNLSVVIRQWHRCIPRSSSTPGTSVFLRRTCKLAPYLQQQGRSQSIRVSSHDMFVSGSRLPLVALRAPIISARGRNACCWHHIQLLCSPQPDIWPGRARHSRGKPRPGWVE